MNAKLRDSLATDLAAVAMATIGGRITASRPMPRARRQSSRSVPAAGRIAARKDRAQSSNLLVVNGTLYLIDAGGGVTRRIVQVRHTTSAKSERSSSRHPHSDHTAGLATLAGFAVGISARRADRIYGGGVEALVKGAIDYLTPNAEIRWAEGKKRPMADTFHAHDIEPGLVYQDANVKVTAVENTHFHFQPGTPPYGKYKSYSYRFETPDRVVFFTGDTGPSDAVVELAKGADLYVTETTSPEDVVENYSKRTAFGRPRLPAEQEGFLRHMHEEHVTPEDVGKMAAKAGVKAVVMTHLGPTVDPKDDFQRYVDEAKKYYAGPITLAKDLMKF